MDNEIIVIVGKGWWWDQNNFKDFVYEIIFMNNVKQFKKYYHGMSPPLPNCCQQHYIFISWKTRVPWK
jgi:hypothetical protein